MLVYYSFDTTAISPPLSFKLPQGSYSRTTTFQVKLVSSLITSMNPNTKGVALAFGNIFVEGDPIFLRPVGYCDTKLTIGTTRSDTFQLMFYDHVTKGTIGDVFKGAIQLELEPIMM